MFDLLLRRARLADDSVTDIAIKDGKIAALGEIQSEAVRVVSLQGSITSALAGLTCMCTAIQIPQFITMNRTVSVLLAE